MATKKETAASEATPFPAPWAAQGAAAALDPIAQATDPIAPEDKQPETAPAVIPTVEVADELVDTVTATVPKAFILRLDHFREIAFKAGVQEMERAHAEHWYSLANGVQVYKPAKS